jgi:RNA-directed DNA polymerase
VSRDLASGQDPLTRLGDCPAPWASLPGPLPAPPWSATRLSGHSRLSETGGTPFGHHFVRYADDVNIYVRSRRAGERVLASVKGFLEKRLKLRVNLEKGAVDRPWRRVLLGFTFVGRQFRRRVSAKALKALRWTVKQKTCRMLGVGFRSLVTGLSKPLRGWWSYYGFSEVPTPLQEMEKWIRHRLRCYLWKQWGRRGYRELKRRGVSVGLAWNTSKSAHGPWRLSQSPALTSELPAKYFRKMGLPRLANG